MVAEKKGCEYMDVPLHKHHRGYKAFQLILEQWIRHIAHETNVLYRVDDTRRITPRVQTFEDILFELLNPGAWHSCERHVDAFEHGKRERAVNVHSGQLNRAEFIL